MPVRENCDNCGGCVGGCVGFGSATVTTFQYTQLMYGLMSPAVGDIPSFIITCLAQAGIYSIFMDEGIVIGNTLGECCGCGSRNQTSNWSDCCGSRKKQTPSVEYDSLPQTETVETPPVEYDSLPQTETVKTPPVEYDSLPQTETVETP